jgi:hypothetical protein
LSLTVSLTTLSNNLALGGVGGFAGTGGDGANGGHGLGGGLFVAASSVAALQNSTIIGNEAEGGFGGYGGIGGIDGNYGDGVGGGVYLTATGSTEKNSTISGNTASTSDNDVHGSFS